MNVNKLTAILLTAAVCVTGCGSNAGNTSDAADSAISAAAVSDGSGASSTSDTESESASEPESTPGSDESDGSSSSESESEETLADHVTGIKDFSIIVGQTPDVMAGVSWDDEIGTVVCDASQVNWENEGEQKLTYVIAGNDKTIEDETITVTVLPDLDYHISGMEGDSTIEPGSGYDAMKGLTWDDTIESVTADTSQLDTSKPGEYMISYTLTSKEGQKQVVSRFVRVAASGTSGDDPSDYATATDLGLWRLTAYMDTPADQGKYVGQTASGAPLVAGRTIAVSRGTCRKLGIGFGDKLLIDGHVYTIEDYGGNVMSEELWADIYVTNPADEYSERFNRYTEVYLLR